MIGFRMRNFKVKDYTFGHSINSDYRKYKKIVRKKKFNIVTFKYTEWEDNVIKDTNDYCVEYLTNLVKFVQYRKQRIEGIQESAKSITLPLFIFIMGFYVAALPMVSNMLQQTDSYAISLLDARLDSIDKEFEPIYAKNLYDSKEKHIKEAMRTFVSFNSKIIIFSNFMGVSSFIILIVYLFCSYRAIMKIAFCENYIEIIQKVINKKVQGEESQ